MYFHLKIFWLFLVATTAVVAIPLQNLTCDFEAETTCAWTKVDSSLEWVIINGTMLGGETDHTLGDEKGHFLTTQGRHHIEARAKLTSPLLSPEHRCLELYLKTPAKHASEFIIYRKIEGLLNPIYKSRGRYFADWEKLLVNFSYYKSYQIMLESRQTTGEIGRIFIDDIKVSHGNCPLQNTSSPTTEPTVTTDSGQDHSTATTDYRDTTAKTTKQTKATSPQITTTPDSGHDTIKTTTNKGTATVETGSSTSEKSDNTLIIGVAGGACLLILVMALVVYVTRNKRKDRRAKKMEYQRSVSHDVQWTGQSPSDFRSIAFSNPMTEPTFQHTNQEYATITELNEAQA